MFNITIWNPAVWGGTPRINARLICRLSRETKQYPIRSRADGSITNRLYPKSLPIPSNNAQIVQDKSFNLTTGAARFKWLLNSKQTMRKKVTVLPVHSVSEFTHSFSFTPSSGLYEWTNVGNSEWFRIQPQSWHSTKGFGRYHYGRVGFSYCCFFPQM